MGCQNDIGAYLSRKAKRPRSKLVAIYPSGREYVMSFSDGAWWWDHGKGSFPQSAAIENVERLGGRVERRPI